MVRIGIDCRALVGNRAGIGRYLYEVLDELAQREDDIRYYLYAPKEIGLPYRCQGNKHFVLRIRRFKPAILWLHIMLPFLLFRDRIDFFWGPNYALPLWSFREYRSVITIHDAVHIHFPETMLWTTKLHNRFLLKRYSQKADLILTDSHSAKKDVCRALNCSESRVNVVHLAARRDDHVLQCDAPINGQYILNVGTIEPRKNIERLVEAYSRIPYYLRQKYTLVIVGARGWGGVEPEKLFLSYGVSDTAIYKNWVSEEELQCLYANAAVFAYPSLYEGFGLPILEAMSHGIPVLCSYNSSLGEVAGGNALLCDPFSVYDIQKKLCMLLDDEQFRKRLSSLGDIRARQFGWMSTAEHTLSSILGGHRDVVKS